MADFAAALLTASLGKGSFGNLTWWRSPSPDHGETYASTASFLLRLLVDDRHVCLVAVAKPIPEPAAPLPDLAITRNVDVPVSPRSASSGAASPASLPSIDGLESLHLATAQVVADAESSADVSSLSSSPGPSLFSVSRGGGTGLPTAPHTRMISPRAHDGRINNTPATSVFSDIFAERGIPTGPHTKQHELPGPTDTSSAPFKKVLSIPPPRSSDTRAAESETILGVVSAQLSVVSAPSEDSLFFTAPKKAAAEEEATSVIDIHLLTLATAPEERGQGLGAKLLSALHGECMAKARIMALRMRSKIPGALPTLAPLSPKYIDEAAFPPVPGGSCTTELATRSPLLRGLGCNFSLSQLKDPSPASGKFLTRTYLEVHPSNIHALTLYRAHGFAAPHDDSKAIKRGFYRGDIRIATSERTKRGGTDAWILQRFDGSLST
ncbi:uncharacterized protein UTRI_02489 [Ustilago trichophora]|uniref:Uncharacterized protein n=1 Tax=Ustilago trichophora TaxID=86804 RepID=A0A5C3E686_9BASI|nr:uncharacterized protein UTRI_02489 [Ustilago trichophora]